MVKIFNVAVFLMLLTLFFSSSSVAQTTIYKTIEQDGSVSFSDIPTQNSKEIVLDKTSANNDASPATAVPTMTTPTAGTQNTPSVSGGPIAGQTGYALAISSPADSATFQNQSPIDVAVSVTPDLHNDDKLQLIVDGKPFGNPQSSPNFSLDGLMRGTHQIQVGIYSPTEKKVTTVSQTITIYKHQASILLPVMQGG